MGLFEKYLAESVGETLAARVKDALGQDAPTSVRLNPFKKSELLNLPVLRDVAWSPQGKILSSRPCFTLDPLMHAGAYYVQDSSAMIVGHVLRQMAGKFAGKDGICVLDLCAAPGGKTTDLAASLRERFGNDFLLVSNEVMRQRAGVLDDNVARWGDPNVVVTSVDPAAFARMGEFFDVIVADVPCSGEGMFRKDPRAEAEWSPETVQLCASRQRRILADVWPALKKDGMLIYSTCTYEQCENDDNLEWAARELGGEIFAPEDEFPEYGVRLTACGNLLKAGEVPGEGQWVGALRKTSGGDSRPGIPLSALRPIRSGVRKGELKGKDFVPDADWALSLEFDRGAFPLVEVDKPTALHFLHKDSLALPDAPLGYLALTYRGVPLGFVKNIGRRCNSLLPAGRRILMDIKV